MVADKMVRTTWYGQNGIGTKCHWKNGMDKMVVTKWYEYNGADKIINQSINPGINQYINPVPTDK